MVFLRKYKLFLLTCLLPGKNTSWPQQVVWDFLLGRAAHWPPSSLQCPSLDLILHASRGLISRKHVPLDDILLHSPLAQCLQIMSQRETRLVSHQRVSSMRQFPCRCTCLTSHSQGMGSACLCCPLYSGTRLGRTLV